MSIALMTRVWSRSEPREAADRLMLLALADNANDQGVCWPSIPTLARKCAVTRRNAAATVRRLEATGHVRTEGPRPNRRTNTYVLLWPVMAEDVAGDIDADVVDDTDVAYGRGVVDDRGAAGTEDVVDATPAPVAGDAPPPVVRNIGPLSSATSEPSENRQRNPHHNHHALETIAGGDGRSNAVVMGMGRMSEVVGPDVVGGEPVSGGAGPAVEALVGRGVRPDVARRLAATFADRIDAALVAFDRSGQYGPGWLVRAVESGWAAERPAAADTPPQGAYGTVPEPRRMQTQAVAWLEEHGHPASAFATFFEPAGTWEMDPELPPVPMYRLRPPVPVAGASQHLRRVAGARDRS